ncbi:asialoglycoprotein receptor 2-like isoform X2 [Paramisgurnus dabryanus]
MASLCLGLLCVLLLACIITQHLIYYSGHKQLESVQNLTLQRDNLLKGLSEVDEKIQKGWWYYNTSVYYISELNVRMKWTESRQNCKMRGADLVIINSWAEQKFIEKLSNTFQMDVWIGLTDRDHLGVWKWVDGFSLTSGFWGPNQPSTEGSELCVVQQKNIKTQPGMITGQSWKTSWCTYNFNFICEKNIFQ